MKTTVAGQSAEFAVAEQLKSAGYKILARNWRTRVCEIDIVAKKDQIVYFVEVKYRSNPAQGDGLAYITPQKLKKLYFSARVWVQATGWDEDYRLLVASVTSDGRYFLLAKIVEI